MLTTCGLLRGAGLLLLTGWLAGSASPGFGQARGTSAEPEARLIADIDASAPARFIAVHGRRALIDGYASGSLEIWAYPFQILNGYRVAFRVSGTTTAVRGEDILRRVTYEPAAITRIYLGPGFVVRERLFVPLDQPGAILTYQVESSQPVEIEVHAIPVLDLMWPGAVGGQSAAWSSLLSAFVLSEPEDGYRATIGSAEAVAHDEIVNSAASGGNGARLGMTLRPENGVARVFVALDPPGGGDPGTSLRQLIHDGQRYEADAAEHVRALSDTGLHIKTPDAEVNQAIAWAEIALDQAWVCNPSLGCGFVAGYGPSRGARRPQYDWFFAGDGLVAAEASLSIGDDARTRQELEFILRYQDRKTGMIWHELSQSAGLIDWAGKYPYMFVHVDITFQFLSTVEQYVTASGDSAFARDHWEAIESAYRYCQTLIDMAAGLPRIPADKEGGDEQDRVADDLGLSTNWVQAAAAFAHLATLTGHAAQADEAARASRLAAASIPDRYWNARQRFWISGHTPSDQAAQEMRSSPPEALTLHLFSAEQNADLLDQLASSSFQTDWGTRSVSAGSPGYDPASYAKGSVWAVGTASLATAFWSEHRPVTALGLWSALLPWATLDSPGHMHEVLAGDVYRPQIESVPEQTWSSAGFLTSTVHGLLGLTVDSIAHRIAFAPHLPATWSGISVEHIKLSNAAIDLSLRRTARGLLLEIDNPGTPCRIEFAPEIPLGAQRGPAKLNDQPIAASLQTYGQETDIRTIFDAPHGRSKLSLEWEGGVAVTADAPKPQLGMASIGVKVVGVRMEGDVLAITADAPSDRVSHLQVQTEQEIVRAEGATVKRIAQGLVEIEFAALPDAAMPGSSHRVRAILQLKQ